MATMTPHPEAPPPVSNEWQPIETVPEELKQGDGAELLLYYASTVYIGYYDVDAKSCGYAPWRHRDGTSIHPTLWCRIPAVPLEGR